MNIYNKHMRKDTTEILHKHKNTPLLQHKKTAITVKSTVYLCRLYSTVSQKKQTKRISRRKKTGNLDYELMLKSEKQYQQNIT